MLSAVALGGPANRQGRICAARIAKIPQPQVPRDHRILSAQRFRADGSQRGSQ